MQMEFDNNVKQTIQKQNKNIIIPNAPQQTEYLIPSTSVPLTNHLLLNPQKWFYHRY